MCLVNYFLHGLKFKSLWIAFTLNTYLTSCSDFSRLSIFLCHREPSRTEQRRIPFPFCNVLGACSDINGSAYFSPDAMPCCMKESAEHDLSQVLGRNNPKPARWLLNETLGKDPCPKEHFFFLGWRHCTSQSQQQLGVAQRAVNVIWKHCRLPQKLRFHQHSCSSWAVPGQDCLCELPSTDCDCHVKNLLSEGRGSEVFLSMSTAETKPLFPCF